MGVVDEALRTSDIAEAEAFIRHLYPKSRIEEMTRPLAFSQRVHGDERATFARFGISSQAQIQVDFEGVVGVGHLLGGSYRATSNGDEVDVGAPFLLRPGEARSWSDRLGLLVVNLDERALTRFAAAWTGREATRLRLPATGPVTERGAALWKRTARYAHEVLAAPDLRENELVRSAAVDMLFAAVMAAFPVVLLGGDEVRAGDGALPSAVRRALAFIEENAERPVQLEDLAAAARMSGRGVQAAFQRHLGTTPMASLRSVRLAGARGDLLAADPATTTVEAVARRWGLHHIGRFAADYRARYGELPRDTLRR